MYLQTCGSFKSEHHKKRWSTNRKSAKCQICGRFANLWNYLSPEICGYVICRTYLRTAPPLVFTNYVMTALNSMYEVVLGWPILLLQFSPWDFEHSTCLIVVFN